MTFDSGARESAARTEESRQGRRDSGAEVGGGATHSGLIPLND